MALGHGSSSSKKHRKSRREGSAENATKPIKSFIQVFWRRHSSSAAASNTEKPAESATRTLSPSHKTSAPTVSSLEQALRIARGQVEEEVFPVVNEQVNYQSPNGGFLPRIPEYGEGTYTAAQVERLKAGVVRRTNSRSDRSEFNSAPPGIYWPDGETTGVHPQTPHHQAPAFGPVDRLPRIAPLSRPTSSVFFGGPRSPVTSFCASPARAVSPTPFLHRPLPPPPFADRRGDKMSKSFNLGATAGPMWRAVPLKSPTAELEVVDTAVYSNVKIPVLRMASPPAVGGASTSGHSPGPMRVHSQSPPPPRQLLARDHRHRQPAPAPHISPVAEQRRNPSPRQQQQQTPSSHSASPALSSSPSFSNCPVVLQGNTQISHHPASPFAPITRVTSCGGRTSPPAASSRSNSDVVAPVCPQVHRSASPPSDYQRVFASATGKGLLSHQTPSDPTGGGSEEAKLEGFQQAPGGPRSSRRRKDLVATYEEAWDVKMSRRLGGMDVSRLAEGLPNGSSSNFKRFDLVRSSDRPTVTPTSSITVMRSPSLSPVLTSTEGVKLREPKPASRTSFRNSSNDTLINREIVVSPFRLKQNRLNLSLNLASNTGSSADQTAGTPTGDPGEKPSTSPPPPPPHRSASIMTPTTTQFSPTNSPTLMRHQRPHDVITAASPTAPRARGVHNPLASGVPLTPSSPSGESSSTVKGDTSDTSGGGTVPGLLPHMSRLLADWDNMSTDSCEEPWDVRQGKVISQLTRSRFIDPSEVLSAVANGNHNGATTISNGHAEGRSTKGEAEAEGVAPPLPPSLGISPPASCASPVARSPSDSKVHDCLKPLSEQPWFHPNLTRVAAEKRLRSEPEGSFLVRNSETIKNEFSLTVKHNGFLHMRITRDAQGQFVLGEYSQPYPSIPHMISHYEQTQVPVKGADSVTLFHPH